MLRFIARQPILDRYERVYGYELHFRPQGGEAWPPILSPITADQASEAPGAEWFDEITEGTLAFIKCPRQALLEGRPAVLPHDNVVLEVQSTQEPDLEVLKACQELKDAGFLIALENFHGGWEDPLANLAGIIKLDVTALTERAQWLLMRQFRAKGTIFIADKVENRTQSQSAIQQGFSYLHGNFYLKPQP